MNLNNNKYEVTFSHSYGSSNNHSNDWGINYRHFFKHYEFHKAVRFYNKYKTFVYVCKCEGIDPSFIHEEEVTIELVLLTDINNELLPDDIISNGYNVVASRSLYPKKRY